MGVNDVWTDLLQLNHTESLVRGRNGPVYRNDSQWGQHAEEVDVAGRWYQLGVYLVWVKSASGKLDLVYIGEGEVQERLCCWEEHNLGIYNHKATKRFVIHYPEEKPEYFCQYFLEDRCELAEKHLMWLYQEKYRKLPIFNQKWNPERWDEAPNDLILPSYDL